MSRRESVEMATARERLEAAQDAERTTRFRGPVSADLLYLVRMRGRTDEGQLQAVRALGRTRMDGGTRG